MKILGKNFLLLQKKTPTINHHLKLIIKFGGEKIPIFAGPNMVESEELILKIAKFLKSQNIDF